MSWFTRSAAFLAAIMVLFYGNLTTNSQSSGPWLIVLAVVFLLLCIAFWPRLPATVPPFERAVSRCAVLVVVGFVLISVQLVRVQVVDSAEISGRVDHAADDSVVLDPRARIDAAEIVRGQIRTQDGEVIAQSLESEDGTIRRVYPMKEAAYIAGYYSPLVYGASNLEERYDELLMGKEGGNPATEWLDDILHRQHEGYNLTLTLDASLQRQAEELLGDRRGSVVLMDGETGAVLALVSQPAFDPEPLFVAPNAGDEAIGDAVAYWEQLTASEDGRLVLRPTQGQYVSGSVFKTLVAAAMIDSGKAQPDTVFRDEGALTVDSRVIIEENRPDPNKIDYTLAESYAYSLNVVFAQVGLQLGPDLLEDYARRFGFSEPIPFDLPVKPSSVANDPAFIENPAGLAETAFGQGQILVTPLQMALIVQAVVNDGEMMAPYLLQQVTDETGKVLTEHSPQVWKRSISAETAAQMQQMMIGSVEYGYASGAQMPGYVVGGKTGTAEVGDLTPHAWFTGFAGEEEPKYVVSVIVENGGSGGEVALPIGRELLRSAVEGTVE